MLISPSQFVVSESRQLDLQSLSPEFGGKPLQGNSPALHLESPDPTIRQQQGSCSAHRTPPNVSNTNIGQLGPLRAEWVVM